MLLLRRALADGRAAPRPGRGGAVARRTRPCAAAGSGSGIAPRGSAAAAPIGSAAASGQTPPPEKQQQRPLPKKNSEVELRCDSLAYGGLGVCRTDDNVVIFCERALPGERVRARVSKRKKGYLEAYKLESLSGHRDAAEPRCAEFGTCGGCKLQNLSYTAELGHKRAQVVELLRRVGGWQSEAAEALVGAPVGADAIYNYRNKMEFSVSTRVWTDAKPPKKTREQRAAEKAALDTDLLGEVRSGDADADGNANADSGADADSDAQAPPQPREFFMGMHAPGRFDKVVPIRRCEIQSEAGNAVFELVVRRAKDLGLEAYDPCDHTGYFRHLMLRSGKRPEAPEREGLMVNFITADDPAQEATIDTLAREIADTVPEVCTVVHNVTAARGGGAQKSHGERVLLGDGYIVEELRGLRFRISANSFFQTNTAQAEKLYALAAEAAELRSEDRLLDLFCGTGTIGLSMAKECKEVHGFELAESAVRDARKNAALNDIDNATFHLGDLASAMKDLDAALPHPDVVITDPNRPGMSNRLVKWIRRCGARRVVYVSCNPSTCARDLALLCAPPVRPGEDAPPSEEELAALSNKARKRAEKDFDKSSKPQFQYRLEKVTPLDLFPHTHHVEAITVLTRVD